MTGVSDANLDNKWNNTFSKVRLFASYDGHDPGREDEGGGPHEPPDPFGDCSYTELLADDACNQKGVRLTFVHTQGTVTKYRHVLLAWAWENSADHISIDGLNSADKPKPDPLNPGVQPRLGKGVHAGGIVWYGFNIFVADTRTGIRVFDLRKIFDLDPDGNPATHDAMGADTDGIPTTANIQDKKRVGRHDHVWYSFGYRYIMPQVASWKFTAEQNNPRNPSYACVSTGAPKASYIALDRSTEPDRILLGEYCRPQVDQDDKTIDLPSTGRIASYRASHLQELTRTTVPAQGWANYLPQASGRAQGAVSHDDKLFINVSDGKTKPGRLYRASWNSVGKLSVDDYIETATGPEDLYIDREEQRMWSISEYRPTMDLTTGLVECDRGPLPNVCQRALYTYDLNRLTQTNMQ
ncbi:hypothetical protein ACFQ61_09685 [Streptomyces sp. NPDC056500]|uniref:hypothetical protein n=1 Tax=Streptomyces sp. NPDC056500 TaxID=3345840 RepID=UPI0036A4660C